MLPVSNLAQNTGEDELRRLSMEMQYLEQTAEALQQRIGMINAAMTDLSYASTTLEGLEKEQENTEMIVPIGGSSYIKVKLAQPDKVIVGLGAGVSAEKTLAEAKATMKERMEELEKTATVAQQQFAEVAQRVNQGRSRLQALLSQARNQ
jgi:prefoldin alpha subunit